MKHILLSVLILILSIHSTLSFAQTKVGKLFDAITLEPVAGATIQDKNTSGSIVVSNNGSFTLPRDSNKKTLIITATGYQPKEITISAETTINIPLQPALNNLQEVILTANRQAMLRSAAPIAISKLTPKMLDEAKATALYEVINKVPGVLMVNYNNEQHAMSIRQPMGTSNYYLYLEDGIPIRPMGIFNHNALLEINQFTTSAVEVVKGPVSSIYGPEAVGGTVNFISQRPTAIPSGKIGIQFDQFGYKRLQLGGGFMKGKFGIYAGGLISKQTNSWMANSDYSKNSWNTRMEYHISSTTRLNGTFMYGYYFSNTAGSVDSLAFYSRSYVSATDFTYRKSSAGRSRITLEHEWNDKAKSFITIFNRFNKHGQNPSYSIRWTTGQTTAKGEINSNDFTSYGLIAQHSQEFSFLDSRFIIGGLFDYSPNSYHSHQVDLTAQLRPGGQSVEKYTIQQDRPDLLIANYNAKIRNSAFYTQYDAKLFNNMRLSAGLRYDIMSFSYTNFMDTTSGRKKYEQLTPKIGLTYTIKKESGLYANFSQGFAPPALTSIFRKKANTNPATFYYNLMPGQFNNYEIGGWTSLWKNKLSIELAFYQMNGKNELLNIRQPDNSYDYQSAGKTLHRGIEYSLTFKASSQVNFRFGGSTAIHRFEDFQVSSKPTDPVMNLNGKEMPGSPRNFFNTELAYYPNWLKGFRSALEWQHTDGWFQDQVNTVRYKGYNLLNIRAGYKWKALEVFTNVLNLADVLYATSATRGNNATDRTTFTPAAPRTFVMGIQYNFEGRK